MTILIHITRINGVGDVFGHGECYCRDDGTCSPLAIEKYYPELQGRKVAVGDIVELVTTEDRQ